MVYRALTIFLEDFCLPFRYEESSCPVTFPKCRELMLATQEESTTSEGWQGKARGARRHLGWAHVYVGLRPKRSQSAGNGSALRLETAESR